MMIRECKLNTDPSTKWHKTNVY